MSNRTWDDQPKYKIVRFYFDGGRPRTIKRGLPLSLAQAHCRDPKTHGFNRQGRRFFDGYATEGD